MRRRRFLQAAGLLFSPVTSMAASLNVPEIFSNVSCKQPPFLQPGALVGITAPSGAVMLQEIEPALKVIRSWGYLPLIGSTIGKTDCSFGGTDVERAADLQQMLDNPEVRVIWCARGGYGLVRIIDLIDWTRFRKQPKWIVGFSDVTILHSQLHRLHVASVHGKMLTSFPDQWENATSMQLITLLSIKRILEGQKAAYTALPNVQNRFGRAEGMLVGGNLKLLETQAGTASDLDTKGKILFVEDVGEYLYSIDRMFCNLKRTGKLDHLAALVIGGFRVKPDEDGIPFGRTIQDIVMEKVSEYTYPVCFDFEVGHQVANWALKCGARHRLMVSENAVSLAEI